MKKKSVLVLILIFLSCCSDKKTAELKKESDLINLELIRFYKYTAPEELESHYIKLDTINGKLSGFYSGTEDSGGHGILFYLNEMENLTLKDGNISFEIGKRDLYESIRFKGKIVGHYAKEEKSVGISKGKLKFSGKISKSGLKLDCQSEYGDCWENMLSFEKLAE